MGHVDDQPPLAHLLGNQEDVAVKARGSGPSPTPQPDQEGLDLGVQGVSPKGVGGRLNGRRGWWGPFEVQAGAVAYFRSNCT
jgi:hypothetical protein